MSIPGNPETQKTIAIPKCGYCDGELANVNVFQWQLGPGIIVTIYCPHCKVALHFDAIMNPGMPAKSQLAV